jgi:hypothetical protein
MYIYYQCNRPLPALPQQRQPDGGLLLNFDPIIIVDMLDDDISINHDMTPRQRCQQLQAQLQLLQQEAQIHMLQEMNGFINELIELAENIRQLQQQHGAGHALDRRQQLANRLVNARNAIQIRYDQIHSRLQQHHMATSTIFQTMTITTMMMIITTIMMMVIMRMPWTEGSCRL